MRLNSAPVIFMARMACAKPLILIGGATASGKSQLARELASREKAVIINADSMQLYSPYPILTSQPSAAEQEAQCHQLYGCLHPPAVGSAASWRGQAIAAMENAWQQQRTPIVVGGTGLYLETLLHGIAPVPEVPAAIQAEAVAHHAALGGAAFHAALAAVDAATAARLPSGDTQRLIRAYAVFLATQKPLSVWQQTPPAPQPLDWHITTILLAPPRPQLYLQINRRFEGMMAAGAVAEVAQATIAPNNTASHPASKTIGVRELAGYLAGQWPLATAIAQSQQATRNYAKRQETWFRNRFHAKEQAAGRQVRWVENVAGARDYR